MQFPVAHASLMQWPGFCAWATAAHACVAHLVQFVCVDSQQAVMP